MFERSTIKINNFKNVMRSTSNSKKMIQILVNTLIQFGFTRVRYFDVIYDSNFNEIMLAGRLSKGMKNGKAFYGYMFCYDDKRYINRLVKSKNPILLTGNEILKKYPDFIWINKFGLKNEQFVDIPLVIDNQLIGLVSVDKKGIHKDITDDDIAMLDDIGRYSAVAIHGARTFENLMIMNEISAEAMIKQLDKKLLRHIVKLICKRLDAEMSSIFLYDPIENEIIRRETYIKGCRDSQLNNLFEEIYVPGENVTGYAYRYKKALNVVDLKYFIKKFGIKVNWNYIKKYQEFIFDNTGRKTKIRNGIFSPLIVKNEVIGIIRATNNLKGYLPFPNSDLELLNIVANQIALIIQNAMFYKKSGDLSNGLKQLSEASNRILINIQYKSKSDPLDIIVKHVSKILQAENTSLFLLKKKNGEKNITLMTEYGNPYRDPTKIVELKVCFGVGTGLTGHSARLGKPLRLYGQKLINHPAVRYKKTTRKHLKSKKCISYLSMPLRRKNELVGLLKSENKYIVEDSKKEFVPFSAEDENLLRIFANKVVLYLDIAERQNFLDNVIHEIAEPFIAIDQYGKIQIFNDMASNLFGWKKEEIIGKSIVLIHKDKASAKYFHRELEKSINHRVHNIKMLCRHKNGDLIPISLSGTLLFDKADERTGSIGVCRDLREIKKQEEEERMAIFGKITTGMAHEIRDDIESIMIDAQDTKDRLKSNHIDMESFEGFLNKTIDACEDSHKILDWMKHLRSSHELIMKKLNLFTIISMLLNSFKSVLLGKDINIGTNINKSFYFWGDRLGTLLIFKNILMNSIEAIENKGNIEIISKPRLNDIEIYFKDTGRGISIQDLEYIFDPFYSSKARKDHLGLGLFFCNYLVHMMGGEIELVNTGNKGTTFVVRLKKAKK